MTYSPLTRSLRVVSLPFSTALLLLSACAGDEGNGGVITATGGSVASNGGMTSTVVSNTGGVITTNGGASSVVSSKGGTTSSVTGNGGAVSTGGTVATVTGGTKAGGGAVSTGGNKATGGAVSTGGSKATGGTTSSGACTDTPRATESCADAKAWGFCSQDWFKGNCQNTCGTCGTTSTGGTSGTGGNKATGGAVSTGGSKATGGTSAATGGSSGGVTVPRLTNGQDGKTTRYWDCCKPSCGWAENAAKNNKKPTNSCGADGNSIVSATTGSACSGGSSTQCYSFAPWSVSDTLSYGYAATGGGNPTCGKCFQLDFTGSGDNANASALANKTMIVQAINIGGDVGTTQFDLLIPGGGVGAFNACTNQWSVSNDKLGAQYGGFLTTCGTSMTCVTSMCQTAFSSKPALMAGCTWFTGWFNGANNPKIKYAEVACPAAITAKSGM